MSTLRARPRRSLLTQPSHHPHSDKSHVEGYGLADVRRATPTTEREGLREFLDYQREALIQKVDGLSDALARSTPTVSSLSLLSLLKHSTTWERRWFQVIVAGRSFPGEWPAVRPADPEATFRLMDTDTIQSVVSDYRREIAAANEVLNTVDLDAPCLWAEMSEQNARWVALHMIEETARHAGHADIIREAIDGTRGR